MVQVLVLATGMVSGSWYFVAKFQDIGRSGNQGLGYQDIGISGMHTNPKSQIQKERYFWVLSFGFHLSFGF